VDKLVDEILKTIYSNMLSGRKAIISHYLNAKIKIILEAIRSTGWKTIIYDPRNILIRHYTEKIPDNIPVINKYVEIPENYHLVALEIQIPLKKLFSRRNNTLITLTPGNYYFKTPREYVKIIIDKVGGEEYLLKFIDTGEKYRLRISSGGVSIVEKPEGLVGEAYILLKNSMIEYGELTVKDAVLILRKELGIDRVEARRILSELVMRKYIKIIHGLINLY
jgi:hypothetical protein